MFTLTKNDFIHNGTCHYEDELGNSAFMKRKENGFVAKIRFANKDITAKPLSVLIPPTNQDGDFLHLDYKDESILSEESVKSGIDAFTSLVQHWIDMLYALNFYKTDNKMIQKFNENASEEDIYNYKIEQIFEFDELKPTINAVFKNS